MKNVHLIAAARPNFMKVAPLYHALKKTDWCNPKIAYTGQHRDDNMSGALMRDLGIAPDDLDGDVDAVVVPGDVRDARKAAIQAAYLGIPLVHLEAGLRSGDTAMPEEVNRIIIDHVSDLLWTPSEDADANLELEAVRGKVECVGNIMIDAFEMMRPKIEAIPPMEGPYAVVTLHRPSNVDDPVKLRELLDEVWCLSKELPVVFPVHPRTYKRIDSMDLNMLPNVEIRGPMPYVEFMSLVKNAAIVITDSGGVQEETSYLGVPCATVRENTERPITISHGTNCLIRPDEIVGAARLALTGDWKKGKPIPLWDGKTADRCVDSLKRFLLPQKGLDQ